MAYCSVRAAKSTAPSHIRSLMRPFLPCRPRTGDSRFDREQAELLRAMLESSIQVRPRPVPAP